MNHRHYPDLAVAGRAGWDAAMAGKPLASCPYRYRQHRDAWAERHAAGVIQRNKERAMVEDPHICSAGERYQLRDARGIFCCYACDRCKADKMRRYRPDAFSDPAYVADEPIEDD